MLHKPVKMETLYEAVNAELQALATNALSGA
jgi:hypothetical protein